MKYKLIFKIALGVWLILSGYILGFYQVTIPHWNNIIIGIILILFALWESADMLPKKDDNQNNAGQ